MNNPKLTPEELSELEMIHVKGGSASESEAQYGCANNVRGCGAGSATQYQCSNNVAGCGDAVSPPPVQTSTECGSQP